MLFTVAASGAYLLAALVFLHPISLVINLIGNVAAALFASSWLWSVAGNALSGVAVGVLIGVMRRNRFVESKLQERIAAQAASAVIPDPSKLARFDTLVHAAVGLAVGSLMGSVGAVGLSDIVLGHPGSTGLSSPIVATMTSGGGGAGGTGGAGDWLLLFVLLGLFGIAVAAIVGLVAQAAIASVMSGAISGSVKGISKSLAAAYIEYYEPTPPPPPTPPELQMEVRIRDFLMARRLRSRWPSPFYDEIDYHLRQMNAKTVDEALEAWPDYAPKVADRPLIGEFMAYLSASRGKWPPKPGPRPPHYPDYPQRREWAVDAMLDGARTGAATGVAIVIVDLLLTWHMVGP